jgi:hypothetical protein
MHGIARAILIAVSITWQRPLTQSEKALEMGARQERKYQEYVDTHESIATVSPSDDLTYEQVCSMLASHGIAAGSLGSTVVRAIDVKKGFEKKAQELIRKDALKRHYDIWLYPQTEAIKGSRYLRHTTYRIDKPINEALIDRRIKRDRYLCEAVNHAASARITAGLPIIESLRFSKRKFLYWTKNTPERNVYDVEISFKAELGLPVSARVDMKLCDVAPGLKTIQIEEIKW